MQVKYYTTATPWNNINNKNNDSNNQCFNEYNEEQN